MERRRSRRVAVQLPVWLKDAHGGERTRTIDVSAHGVLLPTQRVLAPRQYVELEITLPTEERVALTAMVSRVFGTGAALDFFTLDSAARKRWQVFLTDVPQEGPATAAPVLPGAGEGLIPTFMLKPADLSQLWAFYRGPLARGTLRLESPVRTPEGASVEVVVVHPQSRVEWDFAATVQSAAVSRDGQPLLDVTLDAVDTRIRADFRAFVASGSLPLRVDPASGTMNRLPSEVVDIQDLDEESRADFADLLASEGLVSEPAPSSGGPILEGATAEGRAGLDGAAERLPGLEGADERLSALSPQEDGWSLDVETRRYLDALDPGRRNAFHIPSLELDDPAPISEGTDSFPSPFDPEVPPGLAEEATTDEPSPFAAGALSDLDEGEALTAAERLPSGDEPNLFADGAAHLEDLDDGDAAAPFFDGERVDFAASPESPTGDAFPEEPTGTDQDLFASAVPHLDPDVEDVQDDEEETRTSSALEEAQAVPEVVSATLTALDAEDVIDFDDAALPAFGEGEEEEETMVAGPVPEILAEPELVLPPRPFDSFFAEAAEADDIADSPFDSPPTPVARAVSRSGSSGARGGLQRAPWGGRDALPSGTSRRPSSGHSVVVSPAPSEPPPVTRGTWSDAYPIHPPPLPEEPEGLRIIPRVRPRAADEVGAVSHQPVVSAGEDADLDRDLGLARARVVRWPDDPEAVGQLANLLLLARGRSDLLAETIDVLERMLTLRPDVTETHARLAELKARAGKYKEALVHLADAEALGVRVDPDLARVVSLGSR